MEYTEQEIKDANGKLAELVSSVESQIAQAETLASTFDLSFNLELCYGAGAYYEGCENEWHASSQQC